MYEYLLLHSVLLGTVLRVKYMECVHVKTGEVVMIIFIAIIITRVGKWVLSNIDQLLHPAPPVPFALWKVLSGTKENLDCLFPCFLKKQHPGYWQCWSSVFV